ncbi:hypothetical protein ACNKHL_18645 [Shigella flexneri]
MISLCARSPMIASQLARYPLLLDELLIQTPFTSRRATDAYRDELRHLAARAGSGKSNSLRRCVSSKTAQLLRIAAADIAGTLPVMKVSNRWHPAGRGYDRCHHSAGVGSNGRPLVNRNRLTIAKAVVLR